jgi:hypothetical protein
VTWMPDSLQISKTMILKELNQEIPDGSILAIAASMLNPYMAPEMIQERYEFSAEAVKTAWDHLHGHQEERSAAPEGFQKPRTVSTQKVSADTNNAAPDQAAFVTTICDKLNSAFPGVKATNTPENAKTFLRLANDKQITVDDQLIDDMIVVAQQVDATSKPVNYPLGLFAYWIRQGALERLHSQAERIRSEGQTSDSILRQTIRQAEQAIQDIQLPSPIDTAATLKKMREKASGITQPGS